MKHGCVLSKNLCRILAALNALSALLIMATYSRTSID